MFNYRFLITIVFLISFTNKRFNVLAESNQNISIVLNIDNEPVQCSSLESRPSPNFDFLCSRLCTSLNPDFLGGFCDDFDYCTCEKSTSKNIIQQT